MKCEWCGTANLAPGEECLSCGLYNAAVEAQQAAAKRIALDFHPSAKDAWLNEYGVFADVEGIKRQVGTPEQAAPFVALTSATRKVTTFWQPAHRDVRPNQEPVRVASDEGRG